MQSIQGQPLPDFSLPIIIKPGLFVPAPPIYAMSTGKLVFPCSMVDRYSENRRASNYKPTLKERKKTEQDKGDFSLLLTNKSSTPIARNQQLNTSPIMQPSFHLGKNPSGNDSLFQESSESVFCTPNKVKHCLSFLNKVYIITTI